jgi:translation initiation factor IF-1
MDKGDNKNEEIVIGKVIETLPNAQFRVEFDSGETKICYLRGKMRLHRIRVMIGEEVEVRLDPYGGKGMIIKRL